MDRKVSKRAGKNGVKLVRGKEKGNLSSGVLKQSIGKNGSSIDAFQKVIMVALAVLVFYPPFFRGLYFEDEQFIAQIFAFLLMSALFVYKFVVPGRKFFRTPLDYAFLTLVIIYGVSVFYAVNVRDAISEFLKYLLYFACYYIVSELFREYRHKVRLIWVVIASALGVCIISLDGAVGVLSQKTYGPISVVLNNLLDLVGLKNSFFDVFIGGKIYSTLQYSNAFASFAVAVFFLCVVLVINAKSVTQRAIAGGAGTFIFTTMLFAQSRGVMMLVPIMLVLFVLTSQSGVRLRGASYAIGLMFVAIVTFLVDYKYVISPANNLVKLWGVQILGIIVGACVCVLVARIGTWFASLKESSAKTVVIWIKSASIVSAAILLLVVLGIVFFVNVSEPIKLSHSLTESDSDKVVEKSLALLSGGDYTVIVDVEGMQETRAQVSSENNKADTYFVNIYNKTLRDIITDNKSLLANVSGGTTDGKKNVEVRFKIPEDSKNVVLELGNHFSGTNVTFYSASIKENISGRVENVVLKYKYLPQDVVERFENFTATKSYIERSIFNKDGFELFKGSWFAGYGGGAWQHLYSSKQSYLYWTTQAHNYILQLGIETGVLGIFVFAGMMVIILIMFLSEYVLKRKSENEWGRRNIQSALFVAIAGMVAHSLGDFDFSLSSVFLLLSVLMALFNSRYDGECIGDVVCYKNRVLAFVMEFVRKITFTVPKFNVNPLFVAILFAFLIIVPALLYNAAVYAEQGKVFTEAKSEWGAQYYKNALKLDPFKAEYRNGYVDAVLKTAKDFNETLINDLNEQLTAAAQYSKYNVDEAIKVGSNYFAIGEVDKALENLKIAAGLRPRRETEWATYLDAYAKAYEYLATEGNNDASMKMAREALAVPDTVISLNKTNLNPFKFGIRSMRSIEQLEFALLNPDKAKGLRGVAFYALKRSIDADLDGITDQWNIDSKDASYIKLEYRDGAFVVNNSYEKNIELKSRTIELKADKKYLVEIFPSKDIEKNKYVCSVEGISDNVEMTRNEAGYSGQITVPAEYKRNDAFLRITIPSGENKFERISIIEQK